MGLFDQVARALGRSKPQTDPDILKSEQSAATITGIRNIISGHPEEGLDPQRLSMIMKGAEMGDTLAMLDLAEAMEEKYLHYRSVLSTRKLQVSALPIQVTAASAKAIDVRAADLTREVLTSECVRSVLPDILDAVGKGYSVSEIIWDMQGGEWRPDRICWRQPQWFVPDLVDGTTIYLRGGPGDGAQSLQADPRTMLRGDYGSPLPYGKYIVMRHKSKSGIPMRGGLSRPAAWAYMFQNFSVKSWAVFLEVYGHPLRIGKYDNSASREEKMTLLRAVRSIAMDAAAIIPSSMDIEFVSAPAGTGGAPHQANLDWWNQQVSKVVLGQTGTSDTAAYTGTANAHEHVREDIRDDDAMQLAATLVRDVVAPVVQFDIGPEAKLPAVTIGEPESEDVTALVDNVKTFVSMGGQVGAAWLAGKLGVPAPVAGEPLLISAPAPSFADGGDDPANDDPAPGQGGRPALIAANTQMPQQAAPVNDALDVLQAEQLAEWQPLVQQLSDPVMALLDRCTTLDEFQAGLAGLMKDQDPAKLAEAIARSTFAARLAGLTGAQIKGDT